MEPITLHPVGIVNRPDVLALRVGEAQTAYVGTVKAMLAETQHHVGVHPYAVYTGDRVVGFFLLNFDPHTTSHYRAAQGVGLEGFVIDLPEQGKGYGRATVAALKELLVREHPDVREIDLTVNTHNAAAIRSYLGAGFEDTGRLYHGGRSGPQHIFRLRLY